jgi:hypothetical protein
MLSVVYYESGRYNGWTVACPIILPNEETPPAVNATAEHTPFAKDMSSQLC